VFNETEEEMNNHWLDNLAVFHDLVGPLLRPNHAFASFMQLCKRAGVGDDRGRRAVNDLEARWHCQLIRTDERRRLILTGDGRRAYELAVQERSLGNGNNDDNAETVTLEMPPAIAEAVLPDVLSGFAEIYAGLVHVRIVPLVASAVKANIANRCTSFGVGWSDDDAPAGDTLPVTIPWCVVYAGYALDRDELIIKSDLLGNMLTNESVVSLDISAEKIMSIVTGGQPESLEPEKPVKSNMVRNEE
jgi:hypothetical protein